MTCTQVREELDLLFGQPELPAEISEHLKSCLSCREYYQELSELSQNLDGHAPFAPTDDEASDLLAGIEHAIESRQQTSITTLRWLRYAAAAAVITLSVSIGYFQFHKVVPRGTMSVGDTLPLTVRDTNGTTDTVNLSSADVEQLMYEYTTDASVSSNDSLLENISDEELEYLDKNLNAGDLL